MIGKMLCHYRVVERLGEGGMGVVYKAQDLHLDRPVALKVLPPEKMADPGRRQRFTQEAKAASALNHPNIITIYDIATEGEVDFIAMEYVAGKTLDQLIPRKGMRLNEALKVAVQIADALAAAHAAGIIHRDLKPSNVMVSDQGRVKVLDFGLVKLTGRDEALASEETRTAAVRTAAGLIVGTASYMSPEQAQGRPVDARSDIFSFGSLLYEIVTGRRAFQGDSSLQTLAAILEKDPPAVGADVPHEVQRLITRCLRKDPERRFQHMKDLRVEVEELKEESDSGQLAAVPAVKRQLRRTLAWSAGALAVLAGAVLGVWLWRPTAAMPAPSLHAVPLTSYQGREFQPALSPDGNQVAFSWDGENLDNEDIYVKPVGPGKAVRLTDNPAQDRSPVWSPDGRWIAFVRKARAKLQVVLIPPLGGPERVLAETETRLEGLAASLAWMPDGKWLAAPFAEASGEPTAVYLVSIETGEKRRLTSPPANVLADDSPSVSPDGHSLAFNRRRSLTANELYVLRLTSALTAEGEPRKLTPEVGSVNGTAWTADGQAIVYSFNGGLFSVAATGTAIPQELAFAGAGAYDPVISWSRRRLVYAKGSTNDSNIWRLDLAGLTQAGPRSALVASTRNENLATYSPDGGKIAFQSDQSGATEIWTCHSDGSNCIQLTSFGGLTHNPRWSPDGRFIAFDSRRAGQGDIFIIGAEGGRPQQLTANPASDTQPSWSHDGRWIYFTSLRTGDYQIWKMPSTPGSIRDSQAQQVTKKGGYVAVESADGRFLYYSNRRNNSSLWRVPVQGGDEIEILPALGYAKSFAEVERGIYFVGPTEAGKKPSIQFLEFATGKTVTVAVIDDLGADRLTVSPDGRSVLYQQIDRRGVDLMLVENFR